MFVLASAATDANTAQMLAAFSAFLGVFLVVGIAFTVLFVWMFWRIFTKAGLSGALGLLCLIPSVGFLVCLAILAFSTWPNERPMTPAAPGSMPTTT